MTHSFESHSKLLGIIYVVLLELGAERVKEFKRKLQQTKIQEQKSEVKKWFGKRKQVTLDSLDWSTG